MNIAQAREDLIDLYLNSTGRDDDTRVKRLHKFIDEVEQLLVNNSIKQTPALFKPFEEKK